MRDQGYCSECPPGSSGGLGRVYACAYGNSPQPVPGKGELEFKRNIEGCGQTLERSQHNPHAHWACTSALCPVAYVPATSAVGGMICVKQKEGDVGDQTRGTAPQRWRSFPASGFFLPRRASRAREDFPRYHSRATIKLPYPDTAL